MEKHWTEKYRPEAFEEILGHEEIVQKLKKYVNGKSMPHLLFVGPSGVGKTTTAIALAKEIYNQDWKANFIELTRSDERGINAMRDKIKDEARSKSLTEQDFKIIYMDEAEGLTEPAQAAFRRTMENYSENARFILSTNSSSRIIDPVRSRCAQFRFRPLGKEKVEGYIQMIAEQEDLTIDQDAKNILFRISRGDLKKLTNLLQVSATKDLKIDESIIKSALEETKRADFKGLILRAQRGDFMDVRDELYDLIIENDYPPNRILERVHEEIYNLPMTEEKRKDIALEIAEVDFDLSRGSKKRVHLERLLSFFALMKKK